LLGAGLVACSAGVVAQEAKWSGFNEGGWKAARDGKYAKADELLREALKAADKFPEDDPRLALTPAYLAFVSFKNGKSEMADIVRKKALDTYEKADEKVTGLGKGLNALGLLRQGQKQFPQAEALYKRAQGVEEKTEGKDHPIVGQLLANRASLYD